jgi:hypothetical protein
MLQSRRGFLVGAGAVLTTSFVKDARSFRGVPDGAPRSLHSIALREVTPGGGWGAGLTALRFLESADGLQGPPAGGLCFIKRQAPPQRRRRRKGVAAPSVRATGRTTATRDLYFFRSRYWLALSTDGKRVRDRIPKRVWPRSGKFGCSS